MPPKVSGERASDMADGAEHELQGNVYTGVVLSPGAHRTRFDADLIAGSEALAPRLAPGSRLVRIGESRWAIGFDGADGLYVTLGAGGDAVAAAHFGAPLRLAGDTGAVCATPHPVGDLQLAAHTVRDTLLAAWIEGAGIRLVEFALEGDWVRPIDDARWDALPPNGRLTALAADLCGRVWLGIGSGWPPVGEVGVLRRDGAWSYDPLADCGETVALARDPSGGMHAAFTRVVAGAARKGRNQALEIAYARWRDDSGWSPPERAAHGNGRFPAIALSDGEPVIVYQTGGQRRVDPHSGDYLFQREGGGSGIAYAVRTKDGRWRRGSIAAPSEILIQDRAEADVYKGRLYPMVEELHRPALISDRHGVIWTLWADTTRRHTYWSRRLGGTWSEPMELRGAYYALAPDLATEALQSTASARFGVACVAAGRLYFSTVPVPDFLSAPGQAVTFLDLQEFSTWEGLETVLGRCERYPHNPVFSPGPPGSRDDAGVSFPQVRRFGGRFIMHYQLRGGSRASNQEGGRMGYAESDDGIRWERPAITPSTDPDVLPTGPDNSIPWVMGNFIDEAEPDPEQRFKGATLFGKWTQTRERFLVTSPDGRYWRIAGEAPALYGILEAGGPSLRLDDAPPEARYRAIGRTTSTSGRALGMLVSPDLLDWRGNESLLDADDPYGQPAMLRRGGYVSGRILDPLAERGAHQIYWGVVWREHGLFLCLYAPYRYDGRYDAALAVSRDGYNFSRVKNGERLLPCGEPGEWDYGSIAIGYGVGAPLRLDDRLRFYYSASTGHHGTKPWGTPSSIGLADLPLDGYVALRVRRDAPGGAGWITSVPVTPTFQRAPVLVVRYGPQRFYAADPEPTEAPAPGALAAEWLDTRTGEPCDGFTAAGCRARVRSAGLCEIDWPKGDGRTLSGRSVRFRLALRGLAICVYSFWLEG
ncbi:MAG TPA: hypothetical protein VFK80_09605 [Limnochordia bacterium]|nr:hypothetical protein [Limnochordia bacterium]